MVRDRDRVPSRVHDVPVGVAQGGGGGVVWADVTRKIIMSSGYGLQLKAWVWSVVDKRGSCGLSGAAFITKKWGRPFFDLASTALIMIRRHSRRLMIG